MEAYSLTGRGIGRFLRESKKDDPPVRRQESSLSIRLARASTTQALIAMGAIAVAPLTSIACDRG